MPQVNGKPYRTFGQGYAAEKAKSNEVGAPEDKGGQKGSIAHVKHLGGGKFKVKHDDGQTSEHDSAEEMHAHLDQHFGMNDSEGQDDSTDSYDDDDDGDEGSEALKSILG
jgi:hypothetical protein